jgi:hypothetical protein
MLEAASLHAENKARATEFTEKVKAEAHFIFPL